ncbi:MAG: oligosaccharide flippase family protein, partial [Gemmatimonadetes bacterium]|nr:oligosaccharide flippase family protein [Gemmatimonadota bacterium]
FSWAKLKALLPFGFNVSGANLLNNINNNLDKVYFVPVLLGPVAAGLYAFAYQYTMVPLNRASVVLPRVIFPAFSVVQRNNQTLRLGYTRTITAIALLSWPALIGGFIYGREILLLVKGEEMLPALNPLRLLILAGMLKAVGTVVGSVFLAKGKANWSFRWTLVNLIVFVPALYWGVRYGIDGIAAVLSAAAVLFLVVTQILVNRLIDLRMIDYFKSFVGPFLTTLWVAVALVAVRSLTDLKPVEALLLGAVIGSIAYAFAVRLFAWAFVMRFWRDFRGQ